MLIEKLKTEILPAAFNKDGIKYIGFKFDTESMPKDQFCSNAVFIMVTVCKNNEKVEMPVLVKFEPFDETVKKTLNSNVMFYNEVFMYSRMLPYLNKENIAEDSFAGFYYGNDLITGSDNVIIMEDLRSQNYHLSESTLNLDFDHLSLALTKLGRFHALSYAAKERSLEEFTMMATNFKEPLHKDNGLFHFVSKACVHRAVQPLLEKGKHIEVLERFLKRIDNNFLDIFQNLTSADDPLAVICHGDFCRNNMLFQYTDGKPSDVKFFDMATSRCSSVAIDISLLLFLNCSKEVRHAHWDDLLQSYHTSLSSAVPGITVPSLEEIKEAMRQKAIWGFMHCSFFLPVMKYDIHIDENGLKTWSKEEIVNFHLAIGGEEGTELISDLTEELVDRQFITLGHSWM
ncbi:uncharacterized protein LOC124365782 [Homalodisca vitripennis]|uniref:uncharacterized protein LOC124365782 n=1 Tax=Homalodisca vitripennis TaxID=197043 RepID=UPI001EECA1D9|nr:uncharacterized protein LOC124365782 [Homalodisca vitripennis]KAG8338666.1 hypothetical protein J6590_000341 [Homalodisca vitripennis]